MVKTPTQQPVAADLTALAEKCGAERQYPPYPGPEDFRWSMSAVQLQEFAAALGSAPATPVQPVPASEAARLLRGADVLFAHHCTDATAANWLDDVRAYLAAPAAPASAPATPAAIEAVKVVEPAMRDVYAALRAAGLMLVRTEHGLRIDPSITDATAASHPKDKGEGA